jgi:hypothetical protein
MEGTRTRCALGWLACRISTQLFLKNVTLVVSPRELLSYRYWGGLLVSSTQLGSTATSWLHPIFGEYVTNFTSTNTIVFR